MSSIFVLNTKYHHSRPKQSIVQRSRDNVQKTIQNWSAAVEVKEKDTLPKSDVMRSSTSIDLTVQVLFNANCKLEQVLNNYAIQQQNYMISSLFVPRI